jgi:hypothetical protein
MSVGGYRNGSGRAKSGYYKGIYCGSTYELCWVIYSIDHQISFTRFPGKLEKDGVVYYPDFLLSDNRTIIETKGYEKQNFVDKKTNVAESFGYIVKVLRKEDLVYAFEYVKSVYKTDKFYTLYDAYKPKYKHSCSHCNTVYETDKKIKTEIKFCSRVCSGKFRKSKNVMDEEMKQRISKKLLGKKYVPYKKKHKQMWITDGSINTKIKYDEIIPSGFKRGRTSKNMAH